MTDGDSSKDKDLGDSIWMVPARLLFGIVLLALTVELSDFKWPQRSLAAGVEITQFWINCSAIYAVIFERKAIKRFFVRILILWRSNWGTTGRDKIVAPAVGGIENPVRPTSRGSGKQETPATYLAWPKWVAAAAFIVGMSALLILSELSRGRGTEGGGLTTEKVLTPDIAADKNRLGTPENAIEVDTATDTQMIERQSGEYCWDLAARCVGDGARWLELVPLNPGIYRNERTCNVDGNNLGLKAPKDWNCV